MMSATLEGAKMSTMQVKVGRRSHQTEETRSKRVFTNENIVSDEYDYNAASSEAPSKVSLPADMDPCLRDLVSEGVGLKKRDQPLYLTSVPSVLGVSVEELRQEVGELEAWDQGMLFQIVVRRSGGAGQDE